MELGPQVFNPPPSIVEPSPDFCRSVSTDYLRGTVRSTYFTVRIIIALEWGRLRHALPETSRQIRKQSYPSYYLGLR